MANLRGFIARHPLLAYYILAFAISWLGVFAVVGPRGFPGTTEALDRLFPMAFLAMLTGPTISCILLTGLLHGPAGFRELRARLLRWRVGASWYALALLAAPVLMGGTLLVLAQASPTFLPGIATSDDKGSHVLFGLFVGLAAGIFEELGWTGFAIPRLRRHHSVLATGLIMGVVWGAWHILVNVWSFADYSGSLPPTLYLAGTVFFLLTGTLPAFRVLMVWVYERTGSVLLAMLMHLSVTASVLILGPAVTGAAALTYELVLALVLWAVVAAGVLAGRTHRAPRPILGPVG